MPHEAARELDVLDAQRKLDREVVQAQV